PRRECRCDACQTPCSLVLPSRQLSCIIQRWSVHRPERNRLLLRSPRRLLQSPTLYQRRFSAMPRPSGPPRERRERRESFQSFNRPKTKVVRFAAVGKTYVDYKDTETLRRMVSANGKML